MASYLQINGNYHLLIIPKFINDSNNHNEYVEFIEMIKGFYFDYELSKRDIENIGELFKNSKCTNFYFEMHEGYAYFHFGTIGVEFISNFKNTIKITNELDWLITEDMLTLCVSFDNDIIEL